MKQIECKALENGEGAVSKQSGQRIFLSALI